MTETIASIKNYLDKQQPESLEQLGGIMQGHGVRHVYLTHGTFAGEDSLGVINLFSPLLGKFTISVLKFLAKKRVDLMFQDLGNYTDEYTDKLAKGIGNGITCSRFSWAGGNYHLARLKGAVELINEIATKIQSGAYAADDHIWLLGHSHAGQVYALLTLFLAASDQVGQLYKVVTALNDVEQKYDVNQLRQSVERINNSQVHFDIATFGTPPRYDWGDSDCYTLVNIINDHSVNLADVSIAALLCTRDGDYVQQWGGTGTDFIAPSKYENDLNIQLDEILQDKGLDLSVALGNFKKTERIIPTRGKIFCVDYGDKAPSIFRPNCISSLFGHGAYTQHEFMYFNTSLLVNEFYRDSSG